MPLITLQCSSSIWKIGSDTGGIESADATAGKWIFEAPRCSARGSLSHACLSYSQEIAKTKANGAFVITSNVDGQFQKAGFGRELIYEVHGSIHHLQCQRECLDDIWSADEFLPVVDEEACELLSDFPYCPLCHEIARPNILMFGDWSWLSQRAKQQALQFHAWSQSVKRLVILELGAGLDIPTIRSLGERQQGTLVRINPRDHEAPDNGIALPQGALDALRQIHDNLERSR